MAVAMQHSSFGGRDEDTLSKFDFQNFQCSIFTILKQKPHHLRHHSVECEVLKGLAIVTAVTLARNVCVSASGAVLLYNKTQDQHNSYFCCVQDEFYCCRAKQLQRQKLKLHCTAATLYRLSSQKRLAM